MIPAPCAWLPDSSHVHPPLQPQGLTMLSLPGPGKEACSRRPSPPPSRPCMTCPVTTLTLSVNLLHTWSTLGPACHCSWSAVSMVACHRDCSLQCPARAVCRTRGYGTQGQMVHGRHSAWEPRARGWGERRHGCLSVPPSRTRTPTLGRSGP